MYSWGGDPGRRFALSSIPGMVPDDTPQYHGAVLHIYRKSALK